MVLFEDLLSVKDFMGAVDDLAGDFRKTYGLPAVHQVGLVVRDVEAAAEELEAKGFGPFFIATGAPVFWKERGETREVSGKLGLATHEGVELELLEPLNGSDFYTRSLDPGGKIVVQHLGFLTEDVDGYAEKASKDGIPLYVRGQLKAFPSKTDFAYMEPLKENGLIMEFINWQLMGKSIRPPARLFKFIGHLEKWTGKRSIAL